MVRFGFVLLTDLWSDLLLLPRRPTTPLLSLLPVSRLYFIRVLALASILLALSELTMSKNLKNKKLIKIAVSFIRYQQLSELL